ncbi:MAG: cation transporter [Chlorobi bacterium]|nr:cation transporter [Chlorobiota bacterium]
MGHHHHHISGKNLGWAVILNVLITVVQIIGGVVAGSLAIISDALHNFSDVLSLVIAYFAHKLSKRKQSYLQTFGFKRAEVLAAFINASTLIMVAIYLIAESVKRLLEPREVMTDLVIWLAAFSIMANGISVLLLMKDAKHNINMRAAYWHLLSDMLTSIAVLAGGLIMKYTGIYGIDAVLSILIALYLIVLGIKLWRESFEILMEFAPREIDIAEISRRVKEVEDVKNIHHIHIWRLTDHDVHLEAHLTFKRDIPLSRFDRVCAQVEEILRRDFGITHTNLQPEYDRKDSQLLIIQDH